MGLSREEHKGTVSDVAMRAICYVDCLLLDCGLRLGLFQWSRLFCLMFQRIRVMTCHVASS
jgi:hypothetical protein